MNDALYRDATERTRRELAARITDRRRELADAGARRRLYAARVGRSAGGGGMVATMLVGWPLLAVLGSPVDFNGWACPSQDPRSYQSGALTMVLLSSWAIGVVS